MKARKTTSSRARNGIELRLDPRMNHVTERDEERAEKHEQRHHAQLLQRPAEHGDEARQHHPLDAAQIRGHFRLRRGINGLEKPLPKDAVIDDGLVEKPREARRPVDLPLPFRRAGRAKKDQVLESQHRFRFAVAFLLLAKRGEREAPVMPHDGARRERDDAAIRLQPPAEIHVVARLAILGIESAHAFKRRAVKRHVAAGNVLGHHIGEQHMARTAGRGGDGGMHPIHRRRRDIRAADSDIIAAEQRADHVVQPVRIGHAIAVRIGKDFAGRGLRAGIARIAQAHVGLHDADEIREAASPPVRGARVRRASFSNAATISCVSSFDPSSTSTISKSG